MADGVAVSKQGINAGAQAVAAVVVVGGLLGGAWALGETGQGSSDRRPAACSNTEDEDLPAGYLSGGQLCAALNRPDLPVLLGTPEESALTATGGVSWSTPVGGEKIATPVARIQLKTYHVKLSASHDRVPVTGVAGLLGGTAQKTTVLGRPAVLGSERTLSLSVGGGKAWTGSGGIARYVLVAKDARDSGGCFEVVIWRADGGLPDDAALLRTAERVLPTVPGWAG
ncbi:DUF6215 domain-containing protein [Streptomyces sp. NPDC048270]|uniref:DUF6215 domain-containing protein n=1 Tax=Streptomyces sp. NPDC048270 TaxID=3154615 RepID=UPI0033C439B8